MSTRRRLAPRAMQLPALALWLTALLACSDSQDLTTAPAFDASARALAPVSLDWQEQARLLVSSNRLNPLAASRVYAALAVAQYGAVVEADSRGADATLPAQGYGSGGRSRYEAERGAVAGASAGVLKFFFPAAATTIDQLVQTQSTEQNEVMHPQFQRGLDVGANTANQLIERTKSDRFTDPWTGTVPTGPGMWISNGAPFLPLHGNTNSFFLTSGAQFRPAAPPAFNSAAFLTDLEEIKTLSANRTPEQQASAVNWNFPLGTATPPGFWNESAGDYILEYRLNERAATHVLALANAAMFDASIGCWEAKYHYWVIRPSQATTGITLPIGLPNHPSYPSGHSCVSAAAATVLGNFFPAKTSELQGWVTQAGLSRLYAGIHYRFDITAGQTLGNAVGQLAITVDRRDGMLSVLR